jgi:MinD-like ATPase involved in chromosome partitioning or flagellar assembly
MTAVVVAVDGPDGTRLAGELVREGQAVLATPAAGDPALGAALPDGTEILVLQARADTLTAALVAACDARGIRIAPLCDDEGGRRLAAHFGLSAPLPLGIDGWMLAEAFSAPAARPARAAVTAAQADRPARGRVVAVWGPHGAPGRSTLAVEIAAELGRGGGRVALVDADSHAPSIALALGLADEGPGFAAACRQAERGGIDAVELARISMPVRVAGGTVEVLTGINRPGRWPELGEAKVDAVLDACRAWVDTTVVDVAASLERDEEIVSDLDGPRRNAATLAAVRSADLVVAVCGGDPAGIARFLRAHAELRATIGTTPVVTVVNRLRPGTLGIDARGQVRRTLERFGGIPDVRFVPLDPRSADAALLAGRPVADVAPRSPLAAAIRRLVGEAVAPPAPGALRARGSRGPATVGAVSRRARAAVG